VAIIIVPVLRGPCIARSIGRIENAKTFDWLRGHACSCGQFLCKQIQKRVLPCTTKVVHLKPAQRLNPCLYATEQTFDLDRSSRGGMVERGENIGGEDSKRW
jgi:hypothetical protein